MGEQLLENSILDQFINSHEQSHEEFLNTFTCLLKATYLVVESRSFHFGIMRSDIYCGDIFVVTVSFAEVLHLEKKRPPLVGSQSKDTGVLYKVTVVFESQVFHQSITWKGFKGFTGLLLALSPGFEDKKKEEKTIQGNQVDYLRKIFFTSELSDRNKQNGSPERSKEMWVSLPSQMPNEDKVFLPIYLQTMMNERWKAGRSEGKILSLSERVKQVDKYLDWEDIDSDEETCSAGSLVLPGEVEQTVTYCTPVFDKPIQMKFRNLSVPQPLDSKPQELLGDDVQPFSLDEEFDYDNVAVTPKFSEAELKAIKELSKEKKMGSA